MKHTSGLLLFCSLLSLPLVAQNANTSTDDAIQQIPKPDIRVDEATVAASAEGERAYKTTKGHKGLGVRLNDVQGAIFTGLFDDCQLCGVSGFTVIIYTPEEWISMGYATAQSPRYLHVVALPSTPTYLTGPGLSLSSSVHSVGLSNTSRGNTVQAVEFTTAPYELNSAFRSATMTAAQAAFRIEDVEAIRSQDRKREFFVIVEGDNEIKRFKVKAKFHL